MNSMTHSCRFSNIHCWEASDSMIHVDSSISTTVRTFSVPIKFNHIFYHFNILTRKIPPYFYDCLIVLVLIVSNSQNLTKFFSESGLFNIIPFNNGYHVTFFWFHFQSHHSMRWRLVSQCWC